MRGYRITMPEIDRDRGKVLLYADHNADDRVLVKEGLARAFPDVTLVSVADGQALMEYLQSVSQPNYRGPGPVPDAIMLELNMPKKNGFEALAEIRAMGTLGHVPVVVFSTSNNEKDMDDAFQLGASAFIRKPRSSEELMAALRSVIENGSHAEPDAAPARLDRAS